MDERKTMNKSFKISDVNINNEISTRRALKCIQMFIDENKKIGYLNGTIYTYKKLIPKEVFYCWHTKTQIHCKKIE